MKMFGIKTYLGFMVILALIFAAGQVNAGYVSDRSDLNDLLGEVPPPETFEKFEPDEPAELLEKIVLNSQTMLDDQSGWVLGGVSFEAGTDSAQEGQCCSIQWNSSLLPSGHFSQNIVSNYSSRTIKIVFDEPVIAFGVDLLAYYGKADWATVEIWGSDGMLFEKSIELTHSKNPVFFGYYDDNSGFSRVEIIGTENDWSPIIDNVTFAAIPIPGAVWLLGSGLVCLVGLRRKLNKKLR